MCDYQDVQYIISLRREDTTEMVVSEATFFQRYGDSQTVEFVVEVDLKADVLYTAIVTFSTIAEQSPEISEPLSVSKSFCKCMIW